MSQLSIFDWTAKEHTVNHKDLRKVIAVALLVGVSIVSKTSTVAQSGQNSLFLLSGFPLSAYPISMPTQLYQVVNDSTLALIDTLSETSPTSIQMNFDDGLIRITSEVNGVPSQEIVSFEGGRSSGQFAFPGGQPDQVRNGCQPVSSSGASGVAIEWSSNVTVHVQTDKLVLPRSLSSRANLCSLDLSLPSDMHPSKQSIMFLQADNKDVAVLESNDEIKLIPNNIGFRLAHILNKSLGVWHTIQVPGSVSWCRAFGNWVTYVVVGGSNNGERAKALQATNEKEGFTADELLDESGRIFPGKLYLYDSATGRSFTINTGQRDSEPILVSGDTLYFRVNSSIYKKDLGESATIDISDCHLILSDERIVNVHWAFWGQK